MANENFIRLKHFDLMREGMFFLGQHLYLEIPPNHSLSRDVLLDEGILIQRREVQRGQDSGECLLVLEPHPDDFALSCSGFVLDRLGKGDNMTLLNIFSKSPLSTFPWSSRVSITEEEYESLRLYESRTVADYLGVGFRSLRLPLGLKRGHKTPFGSLTERDRQVYGLLCDEIPAHSSCIAPLGIQHHVDHLVAYEVALRIKKSFPDVGFFLYEDLPYAKNRVAYQRRFEEVSTQVSLRPLYTPVGNLLEIMADLASVYRSQFDDINRNQMLALVQDYARTVAQEGRMEGHVGDEEFAQRVFEVDLI